MGMPFQGVLRAAAKDIDEFMNILFASNHRQVSIDRDGRIYMGR